MGHKFLVATALWILPYAASVELAYAAPAIPVGPLTVTLQEVTTGLASNGQLTPTDMVALKDGTGRRLICTLGGIVRLSDAAGNLLDSAVTPYLAADTRTSSQYGSTAIAVHPNFASNGKIYQIVAELTGGAGDLGTVGFPITTIVEWTADAPSSNSPTFTRRDILRIGQPATSHNVADIAFGPDGYLYITSGDGGGSQPARLRAQDPSNVFGAVLRIDPLRTSGAGLTTGANGQYGIPTDNFGATQPGGQREVYAIGFRSPYRMNFDSASGRAYLGDVGALMTEEINLVANGGNYGWGRFEGSAILDNAVALASGTMHTPPAFEYSHLSDGETVVAGFVYRGSLIPELFGKLLFADFGRLLADGQGSAPTLPARLFYGDVDPTSGAVSNVAEFQVAGEPLTTIDQAGQPISNQFIFGLAEDELGEIYLLVGDDPLGGAVNPDGRVLKLTSVNQPRLGVFTNGAWFLDVDGNFAFNPATEIRGWGSPGDLPTPGDWNGDGFTDLGAFSSGVWFIDANGDQTFDPATEAKGWGLAGWTPVVGDWNGDGVDEIGAVSPDSTWFRDLNGDFAFDPAKEILGWGSPGDTPLVGDWNGDGIDDVGVFSNGTWFIDSDGDGSFNPSTDIRGWGASGWTPFPGDWNGDGRTELGAVSPSSQWFRDLNGDFGFDPSAEVLGWGSPGDIPIAADWNGDGKQDAGVYSQGVWFIDLEGNGAFDPATDIKGWGQPDWSPAAAKWK